MLTRLGRYADKTIEVGWLVAAVFTPLYFNVYSSRVFEPDKISTLRSFVLIMTLAWVVKLLESGVSAYRASDADTARGRLADATRGVAESRLPGWLGFLRVPMMLPIVVYALAYLVSTIFSVTLDSSVFGSYQRLQGTYSQYSYMMLAILVIANLRTRAQAGRLINFMILASVPVALYGIIQALPLLDPDCKVNPNCSLKLDPLPWAGDTATRVASTMGNAIFVAAWLIMVVPLTLYRLFNGISASITARRAEAIQTEQPERAHGPASRKLPVSTGNYGWVTVSNGLGIILIQAFVFFMTLKLMQGLPFPDARMAWILPAAIGIFCLGCWALGSLGENTRNPSSLSLYLPAAGIVALGLPFATLLGFPFGWSSRAVTTIKDGNRQNVTAFVSDITVDAVAILVALVMAAITAALIYLLIVWLRTQRENEAIKGRAPLFMGLALFIVTLVAICFNWSPAYLLNAKGETTQAVVGKLDFNGAGLLWVMFFVLLWGAISAGAYTLAANESESRNERSPVVRAALNVGYGLLFAMQVLCIYLTQSRGPWLGLGVGLAVFFLGMWLVGRTRNVRWMARLGGIVTAIVLTLVVFVGVLNIPDSPLQALNKLPVFGRGIERLSTLFRTEDGTGKVRELIWSGATNLIVAEPARSIIGWGPEAMYVAYNPYYPAELAHWELRNATPDRSHNAEFDQMVTMGAMGLFAYYFLVAAFFAYGIRLVRRVTTTRDQLLIIALLSVMSAHFIEIQTGIQIAATWSYFYLLVGLLVAFGYYVTPHLRERESLVAEVAPVRVAGQANGSTREEAQAIEPVAAPTQGAKPRSASALSTAQKKAATATMSAVGGSGTGAGRDRGKPQPPATNGKGAPGRTGDGVNRQGRQGADGRSRTLSSQPTKSLQQPYSSPLRLGVYAAMVLGVLVFNFGLGGIPGVNSATVRADTLYKNGNSADQNKGWPESIDYYRQAIALEPNQDYYYLFLGRSWLEFAKQTDNEKQNLRITVNKNSQLPYKVPLDVPCSVTSESYEKAPSTAPNSDPSRVAEKECRLRQSEYILNKAHELNPLNSDHYANLGRLYLYWADSTGLGDADKSRLAVENMRAASERTPGNAQLRDELAVAYARNNQFDLGISTLIAAQELDSTYARTPHLRGQLYQERASAVRDGLLKNPPKLPTEGETDYGKLLLETGKAYSETIALDLTEFGDASFKNRVDYLLAAGKPFTATNTTLDAAIVSNVVTSTIKVALENKVAESEKNVADFMRGREAYKGEGNVVPTENFQDLWQNPRWATVITEGNKIQSVAWLDSSLPDMAKPAVLAHYILGYIYEKTGLPDRAKASYNRMLALDPNNQEARTAIQELEGTKP